MEMKAVALRREGLTHRADRRKSDLPDTDSRLLTDEPQPNSRTAITSTLTATLKIDIIQMKGGGRNSLVRDLTAAMAPHVQSLFPAVIFLRPRRGVPDPPNKGV